MLLHITNSTMSWQARFLMNVFIVGKGMDDHESYCYVNPCGTRKEADFLSYRKLRNDSVDEGLHEIGVIVSVKRGEGCTASRGIYVCEQSNKS